MTKKILSLSLALFIALSIFTLPVFAADPISVYLDGARLTFDVPPQLINSRTLVPLRAIFEAMGAKVDWDGDTQTVTGTKDSTVVVLAIGSTSPTINSMVITIDQPGIIVDGRTLAPLRFVAEAFGGDVAWDGNTQTASITMGGRDVTTTPPVTTEPPITTTPTTPEKTPTILPSGDVVQTRTVGVATVSIQNNTFMINDTFIMTYSGVLIQWPGGLGVSWTLRSSEGSFGADRLRENSGFVEIQAPAYSGSYELVVYDDTDEIAISIPITITDRVATPPDPQQIIGTWARFDSIVNTAYGNDQLRFAEVYVFNSDGTFIHYYGSRLSPLITEATEAWKKGNYQISGYTVSFSNVLSVMNNYGLSDDFDYKSKTGDPEYIDGRLTGVPSSGYSASSMNAMEVSAISSGELGIDRRANSEFIIYTKR